MQSWYPQNGFDETLLSIRYAAGMNVDNCNLGRAKCQTPPLPEGTQALEHQVAGHFFGEGKTKLGFLKHSDGSVLKPCQAPPRGLRELRFYQWICDLERTEEELISLRQFLPQFLGIWTTPQHPNVTYIRMEDVTNLFNHPCVTDAKIGPITYDPEASPEKREQEIRKFKALPRVGFRLTGIRVYNSDSLKYEQIENAHLKLLSAEEVFSKGLVKFLKKSREFSNLFVTISFLRRLMLVKRWFLRQSSLKFIASSLLLVYEGDVMTQNYSCDSCGALVDQNNVSTTSESDHNNENIDHSNMLYSLGSSMYVTGETAEIVKRIGSSVCQNCDRLTVVKMVDFAHVFPHDTLDENYLFGLNSLISHFVHALITWTK